MPIEIDAHDELRTFSYRDADLGVASEHFPHAYAQQHINGDAPPLADDLTPSLVLGTRVYMNSGGQVCLALPDGEPEFERLRDGVLARSTRRTVRLAGDADLVWNTIRLVDGQRDVRGIAMRLGPRADAGRRLLARLAGAGALDVSGRPVGRFIHTATKRGVISGKLTRAGICDMTSRPNRGSRDPSVTPLGEEIPEALAPLHRITRARRSGTNFNGSPIGRVEFDAILSTACGVTGTLHGTINRREGSVKGRAYPSGGALHSVQIYPAVFAVEDLEPAVYHYRSDGNALELVTRDADTGLLTDSALPDQRELVRLDGVAAAFVLAASFERAEQKYGEGAYRMLAMEAGHISQNLILAATALGIGTRPIGGFFDQLLNRRLGFDDDKQQFFLAVLLGYVAD